MSGKNNVELVQELYRCFREKDDAGFKRICSDDIEWIQNPGFPNGATYIGAAAIVEQVFNANRGIWDGFSYRIDEILDAGDSVVVLGRYEGRHNISGKHMIASAAHVYDLQGGKVRRFRMFADTKSIWDAMA
ncbi:MAG TPA: nuclear transport factor 2 family protein [Candidatus Hydrogenedentes bacterium]|nr:nuclear transport factor 2 family protein [Candidatus Hydrogenedentota bacterium]